MTAARKQLTGATVPVVCLVLLALLFRLLWLDTSPLRGDEAFAIEYWSAPWPDALKLTQEEPHPYGTFALFALWRGLFGSGEWVMRLLPTLLSLPGVAASYALGRLVLGRDKAGLTAALLYAAHPFLIWHAQDARNYAIWAAASAVTLAALMRAIRTGHPRHWLIYGVAALVEAYIFFFAAFYIAAQALFVLIFHRRQLKPALRVWAVMGVLLVPWAYQIVTIIRSGEYGGTAGDFVAAELVTWFIPVLTIGSTLPEWINSILWPVALLGLLFSLGLLARKSRSAAGLLVLYLSIPTLLFWAASLRMNIFRPRYLLPDAVALILALTALVHLLPAQKASLRFIRAAVLMLVLMLDIFALVNHYTNPAFAKAPDWRALGAYLTEHVTPDDLVIQQARDPAFTYYYRGTADETTLPLRPNPPAEETIAYLEQANERYGTMWLIPADLPYYDAEHVPLNWLLANRQLTADVTIQDLRVLSFEAWQVALDAYTRAVNIQFEDRAVLLDWTLERLTTDTLRLTVYWQPLTADGPPLHGFAHLLGPVNPQSGSPLWAQDDHRVTDQYWQPGQVRRDVYALTTANQRVTDEGWQIHVGLYTPEDVRRLTANGSDHLTIQLNAQFEPLSPQ